MLGSGVKSNSIPPVTHLQWYLLLSHEPLGMCDTTASYFFSQSTRHLYQRRTFDHFQREGWTKINDTPKLDGEGATRHRASAGETFQSCSNDWMWRPQGRLVENDLVRAIVPNVGECFFSRKLKKRAVDFQTKMSKLALEKTILSNS